MTVKPLSKEYLDRAITVARNSFPYEEESEDPGKYLTQSIDPETNKALCNEYGYKMFQYYIGVDETSDKVIGIVGQYVHQNDPEGTAWLGWFCINPETRGKGYGEQLLKWNMNNLRDQGFNELWLHTSDDELEIQAQRLYEKLGLKVVETEPADGYTKIYREGSLSYNGEMKG